MALKAPLRVMEIDLAAHPEPLAWQPEENGAHVLVRHGMDLVGRLWLERSAHPDGLTAAALEALARQKLGVELTRRLLYREVIAGLDLGPPPPPSLTITVCTRNRPVMLRRCIESIRATCARHPELATNVEILVVDNAPPDDATCDVVAAFPGVRYVRESVPGLNFARNRAIAECRTAYIAYIDDDAIADRHWLRAFAEARQLYPTAACITGAVLPSSLDTAAQFRFERAEGFFKGTERQLYLGERWRDNRSVAAPGRIGVGANMAFSLNALLQLDGFDEALDTGPPLPGGGDNDMFYRVSRSGRLVLYEPQMLIEHEHRRELTALRYQYYTWGLCTAAFLTKQLAIDKPMRLVICRMLIAYVYGRSFRPLLGVLLRRNSIRKLDHIAAEFVGFLKGCFGEYERSKARMQIRLQDFAPEPRPPFPAKALQPSRAFDQARHGEI